MLPCCEADGAATPPSTAKSTGPVLVVVTNIETNNW
jgi:hypothetical protein